MAWEIWLYWGTSLTIATVTSAYIVRKYKELGFAALCGFYIIYLAISQIVAVRVVIFDLGFQQFFAPAAVFIYPFISQVTDMINEVYGRSKTIVAIIIAFLTQVILVSFILLTNNLSPAPFFEYEEAWQSIFAQSIRIVIASWVAFLVCSFVDAYLFAFLKQKLNKRIVLRSAGSDVVDMILDSIIFITIAFCGVLPIIDLIIGQIISKIFIAVIDTPWFYWYKKYLIKDVKVAEV